MFGSDIIEVAIGMAFLYLFMSMIASALREAIESYLKKRATDLERGIQEMLRISVTTGGGTQGLLDMLRSILPLSLIGEGPSEAPPKSTMAGALYDHPLISSLYKGTYEEARASRSLPSYIPKENFALAILDLVAGASAAGDKLSIATLEKALGQAAPPNAVQRVVSITLSTAGNDFDQVKKSIEDWYDSTMQRVTGWYAKRTAGILFVLGLGAAVVLNVDSITVAKSLLSDPVLRQAIVKQAETYAKTGDPTKPLSFDELRTELGKIGYPVGWTQYPVKDEKAADPKRFGETNTPSQLFPTPQACSVDKSGTSQKMTCKTPDIPTLLLAMMGWLITAIAIMLGAPFWFDMLKKLISLRSALNPDEEDQKEAKAGKNSESRGKNKRGGRRGLVTNRQPAISPAPVTAP